MGVTKNHQSPAVIRALCADAFPNRTVSGISELTEGFFNAAYRIDFADGGSSVLKIAAADAAGLMSNEINLMQAEVAAMNLLRAQGLTLVPRVQHADFTRSLCSGCFFFMECLPGQSMNSCRDELSEADIAHVMRQVGAFQRQTAGISGDRFGLLGASPRFDTLHELVRFLFGNVLRDAAAAQVDFGVNGEEILRRLDADGSVFAGVKTPSLVHWDMWEGNIFVQNGELCGVIDWERAMWGEPLMDDRFRRHNRPAAFLEGYGQAAFSASEQRRLAWYDLFLFITMYTEGVYRQDENVEGMQNWLRPMLHAAWAEICSG